MIYQNKTNAAQNSLLQIALSLILVALLGVYGFSQNQKPEKDLRTIDKVLGCEESVALQDIIVSEALKVRNANSLLIAVIRPGKNENVDKVNQERLSRSRQYFDARGARIGPEKSMVVLGPSVSGPGRIEFYINGELYLRLIYPNNGNICID